MIGIHDARPSFSGFSLYHPFSEMNGIRSDRWPSVGLIHAMGEDAHQRHRSNGARRSGPTQRSPAPPLKALLGTPILSQETISFIHYPDGATALLVNVS